ncbi:MAG: phosphodiester glycosidase family protein [Calditrichia bacterium]
MKYFKLLFLLILSSFLGAQSNINWTDVTSQHNLPAGVRLFAGERSSPLLKTWYLEADLNQPDLIVRPYLGSLKGLTSFTQSVGAYAAVNGGYFGGTSSVSTVVYPGEVLAQNIAVVNRDGQQFTLTRSFFGFNDQFEPSVDWVFHFDGTIGGLYRFDAPTQNLPGSPAPPPDSSDGIQYRDALIGIGGGPTLVKNGIQEITYNQEVFFGSGVGFDNSDPRTAVGFTADNRVILLVADGRSSTWSNGVSLPELANIMIELGCVEAMNLDGGGSSQMAVGGTLINRPEGGTFQRAVPSILAITHIDSLNLPQTPVFEEIIDTEDDNASLEGIGWFPSANPGFWGGTPAQLNSKGDGSNYAVFRPNLPAAATYQVYAWWVASSNRCTDTPVVVRHANGTDTVRVDQTGSTAQWNLIGEYSFSGTSADEVIISNAANNGTFIVADGMRFTSFDSSAVVGISPEKLPVSQRFKLYQNYPNPFNPVTEISYQLAISSDVKLQIYNSLGEKIRTLVNDAQPAGFKTVQWDGRNDVGEAVASGVYIYRLSVGGFSEQRKMLLVR